MLTEGNSVGSDAAGVSEAMEFLAITWSGEIAEMLGDGNGSPGITPSRSGIDSAKLGLPFKSSRLTSRSQVRLKSSEARRNSARFFPSDRLICGSLRGPKNTSAIIRMKTSSVLPSDSRISKNNFLEHLSITSVRKAKSESQIVTRGLTKQKVARLTVLLFVPLDLRCGAVRVLDRCDRGRETLSLPQKSTRQHNHRPYDSAR